MISKKIAEIKTDPSVFSQNEITFVAYLEQTKVMLSDFRFPSGANELIKESLDQTIITIGIPHRNGNVCQVTGTDDKKITWSGMFISDINAVSYKEQLEELLTDGSPVPFAVYYNGEIFNVLIEKVSFQVRDSCKIYYDIEVIKYEPAVIKSMGENFYIGTPPSWITNPNDPIDIGDCATPFLKCEGTPVKIGYNDKGKGPFGADTTYAVLMRELGVDIFACYHNNVLTETQKQLIYGLINWVVSKLDETLQNNSYTTSGKKINGVGCLSLIKQKAGKNAENPYLNLLKAFLSCCQVVYTKSSESAGKVHTLQLLNSSGTCVSDELGDLASTWILNQYSSMWVAYIFYLIKPDAIKIIFTDDCTKACGESSVPTQPPVGPQLPVEPPLDFPFGEGGYMSYKATVKEKWMWELCFSGTVAGFYTFTIHLDGPPGNGVTSPADITRTISLKAGEKTCFDIILGSADICEYCGRWTAVITVDYPTTVLPQSFNPRKTETESHLLENTSLMVDGVCPVCP